MNRIKSQPGNYQEQKGNNGNFKEPVISDDKTPLPSSTDLTCCSLDPDSFLPPEK